MYFVINDYTDHVICLSDLRNAKCGYTDGSYGIYFYFKNGSGDPVVALFYDKDRRDKAYQELCRLLGGENK